MGKVKTAFEKAMEKIEEIEVLTPEERERLKDEERLKSLLADFYRAKLSREELWEGMKGYSLSLKVAAQRMMADSIRLGSSELEYRLRRDGILAIESLKEKQNTSAIETLLSSVEKLQREYGESKRAAIEELKAAVESNPQLRAIPVRTPDGRTVYQAAMSVDEAVQARVGEFLSENERRFEAALNHVIARLKGELR